MLIFVSMLLLVDDYGAAKRLNTFFPALEGALDYMGHL